MAIGIGLLSNQLWRAPSLHLRTSVQRTAGVNSNCSVRCTAGSDSSSTSTSNKGTSRKNDVHVDTRIHWGNSTEGWIGVTPEPETSSASTAGSRSKKSKSEILDQAPDGHYRYLGVPADAEVEEIKTAYRRLSKQYHPDTTSLPLEIAAQKFVKLKDAYDTLSNEEQRKLYDLSLEKKVASAMGGSFWLNDSNMASRGYDTRSNQQPEAQNVDTLGGDNMKLSGQAQTALVFDLFVLFICLSVIVYVVFIKQASG